MSAYVLRTADETLIVLSPGFRVALNEVCQSGLHESRYEVVPGDWSGLKSEC